MQVKIVSILALMGPLLASAAPPLIPAADLAENGWPEGTIEYPNGLPQEIREALLAGNSSALNDKQKRQFQTNVFLCNDANFSGYCRVIPSPFGQCIPLASDFEDQVSSVGPDAPSYCKFFSERACQGPGFGTFSPGYRDLQQLGGGPGREGSWNDCLSSYYCNPN